jgi:hypothetical protein
MTPIRARMSPTSSWIDLFASLSKTECGTWSLLDVLVRHQVHLHKGLFDALIKLDLNKKTFTPRTIQLAGASSLLDPEW